MRNITSAFREQLNNDNRKYLEWIDITLKDGTVLNLRESDVWGYGLKVEDAVSDSSEFKIGSAIVNKATITLNNIYDDFSDYDFEGATVICYVGLRISPSGLEFPEEVPWTDIDGNAILDTDGNEIYIKYDDAVIEKIRLCTMTVVDAPYQNSSILTLTCQDNMMKFDRDYSESKLQYPATRSEIIRDACSVCGVALQTVIFANDDYVVSTRPSDEQLTFRQVISWVAQIGGQWCRCDSYGRLCIAWYDLESYEADTLPDGKYIAINSYDSLSVNNEDVVITGIKVTEYIEDASAEKQATSYQYGADGYVIEIKDNKLIVEGTGDAIATMIGKRIVGMRFRPFSTSMMNNPAIEAGDICLVTDRKGNTYRSLITSSIFQVGNKQNVECGAKSAARNSSKQYSLTSQTIAEYRKLLQKERNRREEAVKDLADRISGSAGLYTTVEKNTGGGNTYYLHNKINLNESDIVWKMTAEAWGVSTDGGKTWNGGMTVDGDTITRILDAVGIRANWINTGEFKVSDEDGNEVFYVNCDTGVVRIKAQSFSLTGDTIEEISQKQLQKFVNQVYNIDIAKLQKQIDGKIDSYFFDYEPTLKNYPASEWTTEADRQLHNSDTFYWKSKKLVYVFCKNDDEWQWFLLRDPDIENSMEIASKAKDTADCKRRNFISTPAPPYDVGDTWTQGSSGELMRCINPRQSGTYVSSDWEPAVKYTDDTKALEALDAIKNVQSISISLSNEYQVIQSNSDGTVDNFPKVTTTVSTYFGTKDISDSVTYTVNAGGGVTGTWDSGSRTYTVTGLSADEGYVDISALYNVTGEKYSATKRFTITKIKQGESGCYYSIVSQVDTVIWSSEKGYYEPLNSTMTAYKQIGEKERELYSGSWKIEATKDGVNWIPMSSSNIDGSTITISTKNIVTSNGPQIIRATLYKPKTTTILAQKSISFLVPMKTQQDVFNMLTNGGVNQGLFLRDGKVYINAEYMVTGILSDKSGKSYWNLANGEMQLTGNFQQYTSDGVKAVEIKDNQMKLYAWNDNGNYVGSIGSTKQKNSGRVGIDMWCDVGDLLSIGYHDGSDSEYPIHPVIQIDANTAPSDVPWVKNGSSGTIFPDNPSGGITVKNGLITKWSLRGVDGDINMGNGLIFTYKNGILVTTRYA